MKKLLCILSMALCVSLPVAVSAQQNNADGDDSNVTALLTTLKPEHPRLIVDDDDIQRVRQLITSHPNGRQWFDALHKKAEEYLKAEPVKHELQGPRMLHQSRAALDRISLLGFLHRIQPDPRYVQRAILETETASGFPDWNPSHFLDTAEMTAAMGIGYDWFYHEMNEQTRQKVREAIVKLGLQEGMKLYRRNVRWVKGDNNWNHVCNGGMIIGALAIADENPKIAGRALNRATKSLENGMALFAPDGGWVEASSYWIYTMQYTALGLSALQTALGTTHGLDQAPGFENTGNFMLAMEGPTGRHFNWGDGGETFGNIPELYFLARHFKQPVVGWLAEKHAAGNLGMYDLIWHVDETRNPKDGTQFDWYFGGIEVGSMRSAWDDPKASFVAFKGGDNMAPHSNNDLGTFVFDTDGERWAMDLGADNYNLPGYWNRTQRLAYYRIRTEGQNTLVINGREQNIHGTSKIISQGVKEMASFAIADLTNGYQGTADHVFRGYMLMGNDAPSARRHLVIQDEIQSSGTMNINWLMHTRANVKIDGQTATLTLGDSTAKLQVIEPAGARLSVVSAEQQPPQNPNKGIRRLAVSHQAPAGAARIVVQISPGSLPDIRYSPVPLASWK